MLYLGIDPGLERSAHVLYDSHAHDIWDAYYGTNMMLLDRLRENAFDVDFTVCEDVECFGMPVGQSVMNTAKWIGRFGEYADPFIELKRSDVKLHLCHSKRAKDASVRQALIDRFPAIGGGKTPQIGTKKKPGPLYPITHTGIEGASDHLWSALAVAIVQAELDDLDKARITKGGE